MEIPWDQSPFVIVIAILFYLLRDSWKRVDQLLALQNQIVNILERQGVALTNMAEDIRELRGGNKE